MVPRKVKAKRAREAVRVCQVFDDRMALATVFLDAGARGYATSLDLGGLGDLGC
ncbi:MAG: hypothetical protein HY698_17715 [Deltaproteobacteria bacterium]|nr:hypothetical protein [Deltaproteobacteria bacterium]